MHKKIVILIFIVLFFPKNSFATAYYVDNYVVGGGETGLSWANAWPSFDDITWGAAGVTGTNTLYISGGPTTTRLYNERLTILAHGTDPDYLVIQTGQRADHDGTVTINGGPAANIQGIGCNDQSWIKISGQVGSGGDCKMRVTGALTHGITLYGTSDHLILEYLEIDNNGDGVAESGIHGSWDAQPVDIEIRYCKVHDNYQDGMTFTPSGVAAGFDQLVIHHCDIYNTHDDGVECWPTGFSFYNNNMYDRIFPLPAGPHRGHPDGIQKYNPRYCKIYNNTFEWYNANDTLDNGLGSLPIVYMPVNEAINPHDIYIYNNVFYEDTAYVDNTYPSVGISFGFSDIGIRAITNVYVTNNYFEGDYYGTIIIGWAGTQLDKNEITNFEITNNIFYNAAPEGDTLSMQCSIPANNGGDDATWGSYGDGDSMVFDYNCYFGDGGAKVSYLGAEETYADFKTASGCQNNEVITNPLLDSNFRPYGWSPVIDIGYDLSALFTTDKDGTTRPVGSAWDIGAYEGVYSPIRILGTGSFRGDAR